MGLMYPLPIHESETDFVHKNQQSSTTTIKSYGLPYIFWLYALAALTVYSFMMLGIWGTLTTLLYSEDMTNKVLALCFLAFCGSLPILLFCFFFYQKVICADHKNQRLTIKHKVAGLTLRKSSIKLVGANTIRIDHFLDSPNMARIQGDEQMRGFKNKGYFLLEAISEDHQKRLLIDRSSSKTDLVKIKALLEMNYSQ